MPHTARGTTRNSDFFAGARLAAFPLFLCLTLLILLWSPASMARPQITFSCWVPPQFTAYGEMEALYRDAFDALGYDFQMQHRPTQRSLQEAINGITDGECIRTGNVLERGPEFPLARVDVLLVSADLEVWSLDEEVRIGSLDDLLESDYSIGYPRGAEAIPELIARHRIDNAHPVASTEVGLRMLAAGRIDLYVEAGTVIRLTLRELELPQTPHSAGVLMRLDGYPYLNRRHQDLLPALTRELRTRVPSEGLTQH